MCGKANNLRTKVRVIKRRYVKELVPWLPGVMKMIRGVVLLLAGFLLVPNNVNAACNPRDFPLKSTEIINTAEEFKYSDLNLYTRSEYEELKKSGQLSSVIPKAKLPVTLSFEDFKKVVSLEMSYRQIRADFSQYVTMYRAYAPRNGSKDYQSCLDKEDVYTDLTVPPMALTSDEFIVSLTYRAPIGVTSGKIDALGPTPFIIIGGEIINADHYNNNMKEIASGQTIKIPVRRDPKRDFYFSASVGGYSSEISIPKRSIPSEIIYDVAATTMPITSYSGIGNGFSDDRKEACLNAAKSEIFLPSTAVLLNTTVREDRPGDAKSSIKADPAPNEKIICYQNSAHVGSHQHGTAITTHLQVIKMLLPPAEQLENQ